MRNIPYKVQTGEEPWQIPLRERCRMVMDAKKQGRQVAILLYHHADTSTFRYRAYNVQQATKKSTKWQSVFFFMHEMGTVISLLKHASLLVLLRLQWEHSLDTLIWRARRDRIPVLFDIDDLVCAVKYLPLVTNTLNVDFNDSAAYDFWFAYISRLEYTASMVDGFITTNTFLGDKLQERFSKPYQIIPNSMNEEQLELSAEIVDLKDGLSSRDPFTIGYFSGTPSHINDLKTIAAELIQLLNDFPRMTLQVVGFMDFPLAMQDLIDKKRILFSPLVDFRDLQKLIAQVDVNIVPLVINTFTNCKSELKFFESAAVNTVTVAAPTYTYRNAICEGETGWLCNPGQWYQRIQSIYEHPEYVQKTVRKANEYCLRRYCGTEFIKCVENSYDKYSGAGSLGRRKT